MSTVLTVFGCYLALWLVITLWNLLSPDSDEPRTRDALLNKAISNLVLCLIGGAVTSYFIIS